MKHLIIILALFSILKINAQTKDTIKLSDFKLCELTLDELKKNAPDLKQVKVVEMNLCADGFVQDSRFENRIGYETKIYPGVIFQNYQSDINVIAKIHLTKDFKGFLPDGNYVDLSTLKAIDVLKKYDNLKTWTSRGCSDYWGINKQESLFFYVKINKKKQPQYPIDLEYYSAQKVEGIDILADCYKVFEKNKENKKPLFIVEGKEATEEYLNSIKPEDVESINVLKDKSAIEKYGDKGKNGVIEIFLKKK